MSGRGVLFAFSAKSALADFARSGQVVTMILPEHPNAGPHRPQLAGLRALGYWRSEDEPELPDPAEFLDASWDPEERAVVSRYLAGGDRAISWRGLSWCRLCELKHNGSHCLSDETYVWPEGLAHYVEVHSLRPPAEFLQHVLSRLPP